MLPLALTLLAASAAAAPTTPTRRWWNEDSSSLAAQAIAAGKKYFGDAYQSFYRENQNFSTILEAQFNQYTFENEMKCEYYVQTSRSRSEVLISQGR
jgi:GH35 family endo-1,4-beta-xylanase